MLKSVGRQWKAIGVAITTLLPFSEGLHAAKNVQATIISGEQPRATDRGTPDLRSDFRLTGIARAGRLRLATLESHAVFRTVYEGDTVEGWVVTMINGHDITMRSGSQEIKLQLSPNSSSGMAPRIVITNANLVPVD